MNKLINVLKKTNFIAVFFYLTVFALLLNNSFDYIDCDLGWHLKVGEQISLEKNVPVNEIYDYTLEGTTWVDHEWLINLISYLIYNYFGYIALTMLFSLFIIFLLIIQKRFIQKYVIKDGGGLITILLLQLFGVYACLPHLGVRMQEITLLYTALLLFIIYEYNLKQKNSTLLWLIPLFYFWASTHAGFLIGLFILGFWLAVKIAENILSKSKKFNFIDFGNKLPPKKLIVFLFFCSLAFAATLLTPYKTGLYHFLAGYNNDSYLTKIMEWQPFYYLPINYPQLIYCALILALAGIAVVNSIKNTDSKKINLWEISISLFFIYMALKSKRHFPLLFVVSFPFMVDLFYAYFSLPANKFKKYVNYKIILLFFYASLVCVAAMLILDTKFTNKPFQAYKSKMPVGAVNFLKNHPDYKDKKLLSRYGWGGYLIWEWPEKKLFIDGRLPMVPLAGHTLLEEYLEFFNKDELQGKLSQYNIEAVLMSNEKNKKIKLNWFEKYFLLLNEEKLNNKSNVLFDYLDADKNWKLVYNDHASIIYVKIK